MTDSNNLMVIPNFSEGRLICFVDFTPYTLKYRELRDQGFHSNKKISFPKTQADFEIIEFFSEAGVDMSRFLEDKIIKINVTYSKEIEGEEKKVQKKVELEFPIIVLRESVIPYLEFKVKDIEEGKEIKIYKSRYYCDVAHSANHTRIINTETYMNYVKELKDLFEYHTGQKCNATLEEYAEHTAKRLLQNNITLKSHYQMRKERGRDFEGRRINTN